MKLYDYPLSGCCYRARLFLSLLGLEVELVPVDLRSGEQRAEGYRAIHPLGTVPVLDDGGFLVADSHAILVYLARRFGAPHWLPADARREAEIQAWLARSARDWMDGPAALRARALFGAPVDSEKAEQKTRRLFDAVDRHLAARDWLVGEAPTIADVAAFPYTVTAPDGGIDLEPWRNLTLWLERVKELPGFVAMLEAKPVPVSVP